MNQSSVTSIVVNWKLKEETVHCLNTLCQADYPSHIIVVDNGSGDGSADFISAQFPRVEVISLPANIGFGAACNRAIAQAFKSTDCEFIFLLNNDAVIEPQALTELVRAAQENPSAGIFGPKIYMHGSERLWYAGARRRSNVLAAKETGRGQIDKGQYDSRLDIDYVFGAAMFIRRSVFERIQAFDERFFLYLEDLDFCLRAQKADITIRFVPAAHIWHKGSASTAKNSGLRRYHIVKSTVAFLKKHAQPAHLLLVLVFWSLVTLRTLILDVLNGDVGVVRSHVSGLVDGISEALRGKRGEIVAGRAPRSTATD